MRKGLTPASPASHRITTGPRAAECTPTILSVGPWTIPVSKIALRLPGCALWSLQLEDLPAAISANPAALDLLSPDELERHAQHRFEQGRHSYLARRTLVRSVLSLYTKVPPGAWRFTLNEQGRPAIAEDIAASYPEARNLHFNLSKTTGLVVCAVSETGPIGVDVEDVEGQDSTELAATILADEELARWKTAPPADRNTALLRSWTLKEACVKALGVGLAYPVADLAFDFANADHIRLQAKLIVQQDPARWRFDQLLLDHRYMVALAKQS